MGSLERRSIETPLPRDAKRLIFSEGINYFAVGQNSIWGEDGPNTLRFMDEAKIAGRGLI